MIPTRNAKCPRCKGTGSIVVDRKSGTLVRCPKCQGLGLTSGTKDPTPGPQREVAFVANREIRTVPKGWRHPSDPQRKNRYKPLLPEQMPGVAGLAPGETAIAAYETTSEGTPISSAFPNTPRGRLHLVAFCSLMCTTWGDNRAGPEAWAVILFGQGAAVTADGVVIAND